MGSTLEITSGTGLEPHAQEAPLSRPGAAPAGPAVRWLPAQAPPAVSRSATLLLPQLRPGAPRLNPAPVPAWGALSRHRVTLLLEVGVSPPPSSSQHPEQA